METLSELQTKTRKVGLLSASKRSFFAANQPAAGAGHENVNGGVIRNELFFEESEQIRGTQREAIVVGNTYRMAPDPQKKFSPAVVKQLIEEVLVRTLTDVTYDPTVCRDLSLRISEEVKSQVKQLGFDRYKIVCITHIGSKMSQGIKIGSLCCWDANNDNFTECSFANRSLFAVTLVFGVYQE
ncbi:dynein light chain Tctex-type protein 2B-like [Acropora palmata]|uniref:dynein light chain Tctex-type protein 2B-like n=2 Tax=Acropora TaxID=6127 RepID=UPI003DA126EA